mmetsp:Transcript_41735/g.81808  ORF Transcript_41735/g.81808 Transcript_41735/m.81808 type:complete len:366 (+) Transcript_41735:613-1710(+)
MQPVSDILKQVEYDVHRQETLWQNDPPYGTVVKGPLEPLIGGRVRRTHREADDVSRDGTYTFRSHGITFVGHGRAPNLSLRKRLLHLLKIREEAYITSHLISTLRHPRQDGKDVKIDFACVGLPRHRNRLFEAHEVAHLCVELLDLCVIPVEQLKEGRLRSRCTFNAPHGQIVHFTGNRLQVEHQVLHPDRTPLPHSRELRRLKMRKPKRREILVLYGKLPHSGEHTQNFTPNDSQRLPNLKQVRVIPHVTTGGPQVNNGHGRGCRIAISVDVSHDVMSEPCLVTIGHIQVNVVDVRGHLADLFVSNVDTQFLFSGGEGQPEFAPRGKLHCRRPYVRHFLRGVSFDERMFVHPMIRHGVISNFAR